MLTRLQILDLLKFLFLLAVVLGVIRRRTTPVGDRNHRVPRWLQHDVPTLTSGNHWRGFFITLALVAGAWTWLEVSTPHYFNSDDNYIEFSPYMIEGARRLFEGSFLGWNPYQFFGSEAAAWGVYALTYPITYFSYAVAAWILGDVAFLIDIFALVHLVAGAGVAYLLGRRLGMRPWLASAASLSFVLSGYTLIAGRSWYYMLPLCVWGPAVGYAIAILAERWSKRQPIDDKWIFLMAGSLAALFHSGNAQMWLYAVFFASLAIFIIATQFGFRDLRALLETAAWTVTLCLPLLIPQYFATADSPRSPWGDGVLAGLPSFWFPVPWATSFLPNDWGSKHVEWAGMFYYSGTLFAAVATGALFSIAYFFRWSVVQKNYWLALTAVAFVLSLGAPGYLWTWQSKLPLLNKFSNPFKFLHFVNLFAALGAGLVLERWFRTRAKKRGVEYALGGAFFLLMAYHVGHCGLSFYEYGTADYPAMPAEWRSLLKDGRLLSLQPIRSISPTYAESLPHNLPSVQRILSVGGAAAFKRDDLFYQAFNSLQSEKTLREWGITAVLAHDSIFNPVYSGRGSVRWAERPDGRWERLLKSAEFDRPADREYGELKLWIIPNVRPLVFLESDPTAGLPYRFTAHGLEIDLPARSQKTILHASFLPRPGATIKIYETPSQFRSSSSSQIELEIPEGPATKIKIAWPGYWSLSLLLTAALCLALGWGRRSNFQFFWIAKKRGSHRGKAGGQRTPETRRGRPESAGRAGRLSAGE